jgi:hypothetical protein
MPRRPSLNPLSGDPVDECEMHPATGCIVVEGVFRHYCHIWQVAMRNDGKCPDFGGGQGRRGGLDQAAGDGQANPQAVCPASAVPCLCDWNYSLILCPVLRTRGCPSASSATEQSFDALFDFRLVEGDVVHRHFLLDDCRQLLANLPDQVGFERNQ